MDALDPTLPPVTIEPAQRPPRTWKFWGTTLWGVAIFAAMFAGQLAVVGVLLLRRGGLLDLDAVRAVAGNGWTISLSVIMGLPAVVAVLWLATRRSQLSFAEYLALRWPSWRNVLIGVIALVILVVGWDLLARMLGHEVAQGFMVDVLKSTQADGTAWLLIVAIGLAAPAAEELMARGFLYRGWSESALGVPGAIILSSLVWTAMHGQYYAWFPFAEVFSIGLLLGYMRYRSGSTLLTTVMHCLNNLAATAQGFWLVGSS